MADVSPVAGLTEGGFSDATSSTGGRTQISNGVLEYGSPLSWSTVSFTGASFGISSPVNTPYTFNAGILTLDNNWPVRDNTYSANFEVTTNFTTPAGNAVSFGWTGLNLAVDLNRFLFIFWDDTELSGLSTPPPQSFTVGNWNYTMTLDGFYDAPAGGDRITSLGADGYAPVDAYLRATLTAVDPLAPVPEVSSVLLLATSLLACMFGIQRKKRHSLIRTR